MRDHRWAVWLCVLGIGLTPRLGRAGGEECSDKEGREAERTAARWKRLGARAIPEMVAALCSKNDCLHNQASQRLVDVGLRATGPLLAALGAKPCSTRLPEHPAALVLADTLCVNAEQSAAWKRLQGSVVAAVGGASAEQARNAMDVLGAVAWRLGNECPKKALLGGFVSDGLTAITRLLAAPGGALRGHVLATLRSYGPRGAPAAAALGKLLEQGILIPEVLEVLARLGPGAAAAVPVLMRLMSRADLRRMVKIAEVLGRIGPPARAVHKELVALLAVIEKRERRQPGAPPGTSEGAGWLTSVLEAVARIGEPLGASERRVIASVMRGEGLGFQARLRAARLLARGNLVGSPEERRLVRLILRKQQLLERSRGTPSQVLPPAGVRAERFLRTALGVCAQEAGLPGPAATAAVCAGARMDARQRQRMASCLSEQLCGPDARSHQRVLSRCCKQAPEPPPAPRP